MFLEATNIQKQFDGVVALKDANLTSQPGKVCGLLGANGSGKSTFSKIISGVIKSCSGCVKVDGKVVEINSPLDAAKLGIAMVHQHLSLIPELTVWQNIVLGVEPTKKNGLIDVEIARKSAKKVMARIDDNLSMNTKVSQLSPSQQHLVEIAKGLYKNPELLILDEPTAALNKGQVDKLFEIVGELRDKGISIIFTSHRMWEVKQICDYAVVFRDGENVGEVDFNSGEDDEKIIVDLISGGSKNLEYDTYKKVYKEISNENILDVKKLNIKEKVHNANFELKKGEILGMAGLQGQGQEEVLLALAGIMKSKGNVSLFNKRIDINHPSKNIKKGMVLVPGDRHKEGLFVEQSILFNTVFPFLATVYKKVFVNKRQLREIADNGIEKTSVKTSGRNQLVKFLSGGNQQKVVFAKWLMISPKIFLLNDPAKGVDVKAKKELYEICAEMVEQGGSVILYASDCKELVSMCDRVLVFFEGEIVDEVIGDEITEERLISSSVYAKK